MVYFTSDLHLCHKRICKYRRRFKTPEEHDEYILDLLSKLSKRDTLYIIGDFLFKDKNGKHLEYLERISKMPCRIKLIFGNHDTLEILDNLPKNIEVQLPFFSYNNMWVSHCPIHPAEMRKKTLNIHGHLHNKVVTKEQIVSKYGGIFKKSIQAPDERYFNVNIDVNDYKFVKFDTIKAIKEGNISKSRK